MTVPLLLALTFNAAILLLYQGLTSSQRAPSRPSVAASRRWRRLVDFLARAGVRGVSPRDFAVFSLGAGALAGAAAQLLLGWPLVSLLAAVLGLVAPAVYYIQRHDRRRATLQAALVEAIGQLRDGIRAGLGVQEALAGLARSGPEALRPEFAALVRDIRLGGFAPALAALQERLADPLVDTTVAALLLNDALGGRNVGQVLDHLARATRAELRVQEEIRAYQARTVLQARIVAAIPLAALVGIRKVNPGYLAVFNGVEGQLVLAGCLASTALGYAAMLWLTRLPGEERVLR